MKDAALNSIGPDYTTQALALSGTATVQVPAKLGLNGVAPGVLPGGKPWARWRPTWRDSSGNTVLASTASVTVTITGPGGYSQSSTQSAASGVATFNLGSDTLTTPGAYTLTAASSGLTSATATVIVSGAATQIAVTGLPTTLAVGGNPGTETATIEDAGGNVAGRQRPGHGDDYRPG